MFTVAPNAIEAIDMRRHARPRDCEENKRHATSRALSSIYVFLITFYEGMVKTLDPHSSHGTFARFNSTYKAVELVSGRHYLCEATIEKTK
jgi:hypothetical protein